MIVDNIAKYANFLQIYKYQNDIIKFSKFNLLHKLKSDLFYKALTLSCQLIIEVKILL